MNKGTLTTLDFVISVLREHEKEMTLLSDKLEELLDKFPSGNLNKDMGEIRSALNELRQTIVVSGKGSAGSGRSSIESLLEQLVRQVSAQTESISLLVEAISDYPTKKELNELRESILLFNNLIHQIVKKEVPNGPEY